MTRPSPPPSPAATDTPVAPVDERLPLRRLLPLSAQHVLAMIAAPVSSVFMIAAALKLPSDTTSSLLSATLVICGAGALLQSLGVWRIGARLPFLMLPGGAATALFLQIAQRHGPATATGSVLLAALLLLVLPVYGRVVRLFPPLVMGVVVLLIGVNMVKVSAALIAEAPALAAATVGLTGVFFLVLRGVWRQSSVLFGMLAGTAVAAVTGHVDADVGGPFALPGLLPFGAPVFDVVAALPLLVFSLASLAEATGQVVLNSEAVGRSPEPGRDVPRTARADAVGSLVGGLFGTPLMVTSAENIGIVQVTGVRSRFVTVGAGALLIVVGLLSPVTRLLAAIPEPVVGGSGLVIYGVIAAMGVNMLRRVNMTDADNSVVVALALAAGLLPIVAPELYEGLPGWAATVFGSGVVAGALAAVVLYAVFRAWGSSAWGSRAPRPEASRPDEAEEPSKGAEPGHADSA